MKKILKGFFAWFFTTTFILGVVSGIWGFIVTDNKWEAILCLFLTGISLFAIGVMWYLVGDSIVRFERENEKE